MTRFHLRPAMAGLLTGLTWLAAWPGLAVAANQTGAAVVDSPGPVAAPAPNPLSTPSWADLVDLIEPAPMVLGVQVRKVAQVEPERARDVPPGWARIYVEARPLTALRGRVPPVDMVSYLADVRRDAQGKLPDLNKHTMLLVARPVPDHLAVLQLVAPDAQLPWDAALEMRVRAVLAALQAPDAPSRVTRVREAIYVPGALVGEGETQIFLATADGSPAAISVVHQAGGSTNWSVSFSEVVDASGLPPAKDTLTWYRLACSLPDELPAGSNVSATAPDQAQAVDDYHLVMAGLGSCRRTRSRA